MQKGKDYSLLRKIGLASTIPGILFFAILIGYLFGSWLDSRLGTHPWMMALFSIAGIAAGFSEVIRILIRLSK